MDLISFIPWFIIIFLFMICVFLLNQYFRLKKIISEKESQQKSLSTIYGKITEQFFPLMEDYPYNPQNFRFIGSPIDGIQFTKDKIIFCEFKLHKSQLNPTQKRIKEL
ncbi:MAG: Holliday junction resolvase-like protein, partial [Candidatus Odinarchaeia archaeon]